MIIQVINSVFFISIEKPKTGSKDGLKVILSIQPNRTEVADLIDIILSRYVHHKRVIDVRFCHLLPYSLFSNNIR
jgi:hypothetical protein